MRLKVKKWYEDRGYLVYTVPESRWSKDIFGFGDLLCVDKDTAKLVQVKSRQNFNWRDYEEACTIVPKGIVMEFWIGTDRFYRWAPSSKRFVPLDIKYE